MKVHANVFQEKYSVLSSQLKVKQIPENLEGVKILQKEILKLNSQLDVKQMQLESSEDAKAFNDLQEEYSRLRLQLEKFAAHADKLKEKNSELTTKLRARQKLFTDVKKVQMNVLQEENLDLKSQLEIAQKQLKKLNDKERCDIAIQTDKVCT